MTNTDSTYREKGRAVFLAAIMVLSMVAMSAAFAAPAAAADSIADGSAEEIIVDEGGPAEHDVTLTDVEASGGNGQINISRTNLTSDVDINNVTNVNGLNGTVAAGQDFGEGDDLNEAVIDLDDGTEDVILTIEYDSDSSATLGTVNDGYGVTAGDGSPLTTVDVDLVGFAVEDLEPPTASVVNGSTQTYSATINNTASQTLEQNISLIVDGGPSLEIINETETNFNIAANGDEEVTFTVTVEGDTGSYDHTIASESDSAVGTTLIGDEDNEGSLSVDVRGDFDPSLDDPVNVTLYGNADGQADVNDATQRIETIQTDQNGEADFRGLAVNGSTEDDGINYAAIAAADNDDFSSDVDRATLWNDRTSTGLTVFINRLVTPDEIDVDFDPGTTVAIDEEIEATVTVQTEDLDGDSNTLDPLEDTPVALTYNDNTGDVDNADNILPASGTVVETDENGQVTFTFSVDSANINDIQEIVEATELTFEATEGDDVITDEETLEFVPDIGDTGTLSGDVNVINEDIQLGTQSNTEARAGVEVHAVQIERVLANTVEVNETTSGNGLEGFGNETLAGLDGIEEFTDDDLSIDPGYTTVNADEVDNGDVRLSQGDQFRVVTFDENGDEVVQDPRSDYLAHTPEDVELIQNESDQSVEIHAQDGANASFQLSFLNDLDDYQVQQKVTLTNDTSDQSVSTYQNITVVDDLDAGTLQTNTEDVFDASEDLTYDATEERYEDDRTIPTDVTNDQGDYELLNLPVNVDEPQTYVVIAGGSDTGSADTAYGFANFRGFDIVDVSANAQGDQLNTDLSVQEFEPVQNFVYNLDVTVDNGAKFVETPVGQSVSVEVTATQQEVGSNDDPEPAEGIEIDLEALDSNIGDLGQGTVTTDADGVGTTTFTGTSPQVGETNISATFESGDEIYTTEDGEQATVDVFQDAQITGDVVDDETPPNNLPGATVTLSVENETGDLVELATKETGPQGSFSFTGSDGVRSGLNYTVEATFVDEEGNEGTGFASLTEIPGGTTNADIVIEDVIAPEGFSISDLQAPASAAPGDEIEVSANITNTAADEDTGPVTFVFDGSDVVTQEITLDAGDTEEVVFDIEVPDVDDGDYEHGIDTDIDSERATLNVNSSDDGDDDGINFDDETFTEEQFNAVFPDGDTSQTALTSAINEWFTSDDGTVDGVEIGQSELSSLINYWFNNLQ